MTEKGIVIKQVGGLFTIKVDNEIISVPSRKNLKKNGVMVGDIVETDRNVILNVMKRKNRFIRPAVANIDQIIIVVANVPEPDFLLIDKMIIYADMNNVSTIICVNKSENSTDVLKRVKRDYGDVVEDIVTTSAINNDISELLPLLKGKLSAFAGQSAVGKSTLLNVIMNKNIAKTGDLSKIERGKNTTRETEIFSFDETTHIIDTPGFSMLDLINFSPVEVSKGYSEFYKMSENCKYRQCDHIYVEKKDCSVLTMLEFNKDKEERYERYKDLYNDTKEIWRKRYE